MIRDSSDSTRSTASPPVPEKNHRFKTSLFAKDGSSPLPQTVAHRGYKKLYPENSLAAFQGAIDVGSHGIETDLQLSRDGVVVISHDPSLKRCFGVDKLIIDCDWEYLSTLRTTKQPHEKLPRLSDLLDFLNSPCAEHAWVLLDIKRNNDAKTMIHKIAETLASVPPGSPRPWSDRIILGCWAPTYFPLCAEYLPAFHIALICINPLSARRVLKCVPEDISFNTLLMAMQSPLGFRFIEDVHAASRLVFAWTVNSARDMRWSIRHGVDAVLTDDPAAFRRICDEWDAREEERWRRKDRLTVVDHVRLVGVAVLVVVFGWMVKYISPSARTRRIVVDDNPSHLGKGEVRI